MISRCEKGPVNLRGCGLLTLLSWLSLLVLQGCGGGGNGVGISQEMYDALRTEYQVAVANREAAQAAAMSAEAEAMAAVEIQLEAEAAALKAMEAQKSSEARRDAAIAAHTEAEGARLAAESARVRAKAKARTAIRAQEMAEDEAAKARLDKVAAEVALAIAEFAAADAEKALARAESAEREAEAAQVRAEEARDMAEAAARAAVTAQIEAERELGAALADLTAAEAAQKTAEAAMTRAKDDRNAVLLAQVEAEEDLARAERERDEALTALAMQREADAARRARVDGRAIKASAGLVTVVSPGIDPNGDGRHDPAGVQGETVPVRNTSTHVVANYQGARSGPLNGPMDSLRISAYRFDSTTWIAATVLQGGYTKPFFRVSSSAGSGDTMSVRDQVRVPGGHTKHIFLKTDIEEPFVIPPTASDPGGYTRTVADSDYLVYGAWLMRPDSAGGTAYAGAFGTGNDLFDPAAVVGNGIVELVGKATYKGEAAGFFAEAYVNVDTAVSGRFTAAVELLADFDAGTVSNAVAGGLISGTITDFARSDGVPVNWLVRLGVLALGAFDGIPSATNTGMASSTAGGFTAGTTSGSASGVPWTGEWGVQFIGDDPVFAAKHPTGVVGTFGAQYGSPTQPTSEPPPVKDFDDHAFVAVIGGFGARKE